MTCIPLKSFYMIRHGETVANAEGFAAGWVDTPLTEKGRKQAAAACPAVAALRPLPDLIIHTGLARSFDTATAINKSLNVKLMSCPQLVEQCYGDWAGERWSFVRQQLDLGHSPPNGESMEDFTARIVQGFAALFSQDVGKPLIVSHGGVFDAFCYHYGIEMVEVHNCELYEFEPVPDLAPLPWGIWHHVQTANGAQERTRVEVKPIM